MKNNIVLRFNNFRPGIWLFFLIQDDSVFKVQQDGTVIPHVALPIIISEHVVQDTSLDRDTVGDTMSDDV
ncbi:MAG: hypothetical protein M0Q91_06170 [Methanoregula sp.]|jgi:hypothetical protein|nr:hypothetical protein [Methanoregula sp.]